jgi:hypothetical protein
VTGRWMKFEPANGNDPPLRASQTPPRNVLPVCRVNDELPDVVTASGRTPRGQRRGHATKRTAKVRAVPRHAVIRRVDEKEQLLKIRLQLGVPRDTARRRSPPCIPTRRP